MLFENGVFFTHIPKAIPSRMSWLFAYKWFLCLRRRSCVPTWDTDSVVLIHPPPNQYYADPVLVEHHDDDFVFFEDYSYTKHKGVISCCKLNGEGAMRPQVVLERPYHLSYPFIFHEGDDFYMIPETFEARTVELYRATEFPWKWQFYGNLLNNVRAADTTLLISQGRYWLLTAMVSTTDPIRTSLHLFFATSLEGPYEPHNSNPLSKDALIGRPAGGVFAANGDMIRPCQDSSKWYGSGLLFRRLLKIDDDEFLEEEVGRFDASFLPRNCGSHTYSQTSHYEAIDGFYYGIVPLAAVGRLLRVARLLRADKREWRLLAAQTKR